MDLSGEATAIHWAPGADGAAAGAQSADTVFVQLGGGRALVNGAIDTARRRGSRRPWREMGASRHVLATLGARGRVGSRETRIAVCVWRLLAGPGAPRPAAPPGDYAHD